jgi:N-acetyl-gamma-glutamyl-phosphate reductase
VGRHQHLPEIQLAARKLAGAEIAPFMTTHLLPVRRGIISGIYARLKKQNIAEAYANAYKDSKLISVQELDASDTRANQFALSLRQVVGTAQARIAYAIQGDQLYVFSLIDNLMKGAASQAVENFNHLAGLPTETALTDLRGIL